MGSQSKIISDVGTMLTAVTFKDFQEDKQIIKGSEGHFYTGLIQGHAWPPWKADHKHYKDTSISQKLPFQSREGKVGESHAAHDVADKVKVSQKNQAQQATYKPFMAPMPSTNCEVVSDIRVNHL